MNNKITQSDLEELKLKPWKRGAIVREPVYNREAVQKGIDKDPRISKREAVLIHRLLKGRTLKL